MKLLRPSIHRSRIKAFTLLEVLASLSIVTLVIMGPLTSTISSSSYAGQSKDVMVATYLAQEAIELLHSQRSSLYIQCIKIKEACDSTVPTLERGIGGEETPGEKAWRLFKTRLAGSGAVSCFDGCSFDFFDMASTSKAIPTLYLPTSEECQYLALVSSAVIDSVRNYYVCSGVTAHTEDGYSVVKKSYSRKITVESRDTFENDPDEEHYYDDLLVTATVTFRRVNGTIRTIIVTDFLRAHS